MRKKIKIKKKRVQAALNQFVICFFEERKRKKRRERGRNKYNNKLINIFSCN